MKYDVKGIIWLYQIYRAILYNFEILVYILFENLFRNYFVYLYREDIFFNKYFKNHPQRQILLYIYEKYLTPIIYIWWNKLWQLYIFGGTGYDILFDFRKLSFCWWPLTFVAILMTMHGKKISKVNWRLIKTALEKCNRSPQLTQSVGCEINQITLNSNTFKN